MIEEINQFVALILAYQWLACAIVAIGLLLRLLKTERVQAWLMPIPARYRPLVALGLGVVSGILEAVAAGVPWLEALLRGVAAAIVAIAGHDLIIESLLGGREIGKAKAAQLSYTIDVSADPSAIADAIRAEVRAEVAKLSVNDDGTTDGPTS